MTRARNRLERLHLPACAALLCLLATAPAHALRPGDRAPTFTADAVSGGKSLSLEQFRGRVVYLDFWASWCGPCAISLPALDALRKSLPEDRFQVLAINVDKNPGDARRFLERRPVGYPSALDPKGALPARFGVETMPTSFLIDADGVVRYVHRGFRKGDEAKLESEIRKLLGATR
jgi:thiol-disulfide isomerase/thioredoxin